MTIPVELRGARILLRQWLAADREPFAQLNADPVAMEFFPAPLARDESDVMVARMQALIDERGWGLWCLEIGGACAGFTGLNVPNFEADFQPAVEIGWRLLPKYWGNGYVTEGEARPRLRVQRAAAGRHRLVHRGRQPSFTGRHATHRHAA